MKLREFVTASLTRLMFAKSFEFDRQTQEPDKWIANMSEDFTYADHYFIELCAEFLNRRIIIYPLFEEEVRLQIKPNS